MRRLRTFARRTVQQARSLHRQCPLHANALQTRAHVATRSTASWAKQPTIKELLQTAAAPAKASSSSSSSQGVPVTVKAWVRSSRSQKGIGFVSLNDGSTLHSIQAIVAPDAAKRFVDSPACLVLILCRTAV